MSTRVRERREATKAAILEAAWEIVHDRGLAGLAMRDLAQRLGMTAPSLYGYFESKDSIFDAMFIQGNLDLLDRARSQIPPPDLGVRDSLVAGARFFIEFCNEDTARFQLLFQNAVPGWAPSTEAYAVAIEVLEELGEHLAACGFTTQADLDLWTALTTGLASQQVANDPGGERWIRLVDPAVDMYMTNRALS